MFKSVFTATIALSLLLGAAAKAEDQAVDNTISIEKFYERFRNNPDLKQSDLSAFPSEIQNYLINSVDWEDKGYTGFSRYIGRREFLFAVRTDNAIKIGSYAAIVTVGVRDKVVSPERSLTWRRLVLPYLTKGVGVSATDQHPQLSWNDELGAVETTHCFSVGGADYPSCIRHTHKISRSESWLLKIDALFRNKGTLQDEWKVVWEKGNWIPASVLKDIRVD